MPQRGKKIKESKVNFTKLRFVFMTSGCVFPETISQVKQYESHYGATSVLLPEELQEPTFLSNDNLSKSCKSPKTNNDYLSYAIAARKGKIIIPIEIKEKMKSDRLAAERKQTK